MLLHDAASICSSCRKLWLGIIDIVRFNSRLTEGAYSCCLEGLSLPFDSLHLNFTLMTPPALSLQPELRAPFGFQNRLYIFYVLDKRPSKTDGQHVYETVNSIIARVRASRVQKMPAWITDECKQ